MTRALCQRALLTPASHASVDEARVAFEARAWAETKSLHHAGTEALEQHVALLNQAQHHLTTAGLLEIDRDAASTACQEIMARRLLVRVHPIDAIDAIDATQSVFRYSISARRSAAPSASP